MKKQFSILAFVCLACVAQALLPVSACAQNWTTVSAANITDLNQNKLAAGQLCFLGTDQADNPISFNVGGGGQVLKRAFCSAVTTGAVTAFTVPNPQNTTPAGVYYRVTAKDSSTGQEVLRYTQVTFTGGTFNFDNYAPTNVGSFTPPSGTATPGNLTINGNLSVTGSATFGSPSATFNALSPMTTLGDLEYESGPNTAARLPGNTTSTKKYLSQTGTGSVSAAPAWAQIASGDLSDGASLATVTGTQSLQNKTLNGSGGGNAVNLLNQQFFGSAIAGNSTDQNLYSYTVPANTVGPGKCLRITVAWLHATGTASASYRLKFNGATNGTLISTGVDNGQREYAIYWICNAAGIQNSQTVLVNSGLRTINVANISLNQIVFARYADPAVNFANAATLTFTFNAANTDTVSPEFWMVELIQ